MQSAHKKTKNCSLRPCTVDILNVFFSFRYLKISQKPIAKGKKFKHEMN